MSSDQNKAINGPESPHFHTENDVEDNVTPWTEVDDGRYMPRRVRGSGVGRALG